MTRAYFLFNLKTIDAKKDILGQSLSNKDLPNGQRVQNSLVVDKIDQLLEHYNFDFATLLETFIDFGTDRHLISKEEIISLLENRFQLEPGDSRMSRFNSTQALKQYCREKYKKNEGMFTRPPKNSHSKEEFVLWAKQNGIDISHFRTRSYNKRNDMCVY